MTASQAEWGQVEREIAQALRALAGRAAGEVPDTGGFDTVDHWFDVAHPGWTAGPVALRIGAVPQPAPGSGPTDRRYVQVRVATRSGGTESSQWITAGSKPEVIAFLESQAAPVNVLVTIKELAESQRQLGLR
ncbi:MAG TPA: hypothetical protein VNO33_13165 [Kofleriaceae bacterium]|nr:hypothetical protein [Kofleriaceae bacterium]